jgi:hypothetical protein
MPEDSRNAVYVDGFCRFVSGGMDVLTSFAHARQSEREE